MLTRQQKEAEVQELSEKFSRATSVFLADYRGLDVKSTEELRTKLELVCTHFDTLADREREGLLQ